MLVYGVWVQQLDWDLGQCVITSKHQAGLIGK